MEKISAFGAITNTGSEEAIKHAEMYYREIRSFTTDVQRISNNTEFSYEQILLVKNYLFMDKHVLEKGTEPRYFDACFEIAESWQRLAGMASEIQPHDIVLIKHELMEMELVAKGYSQEDAHIITNKLYNYTEDSDAYYYELSIKSGKDSINSGAIRRRLDNTTH
ncbi:MAG: hypothetical protein IJY09_04205 [Lachnospiraceae bacterium]|nr:hypothetical protein [Lachnospiraceae bacterium]